MAYRTISIITDVRRILDEQGVDDSWMTNNAVSSESGSESDVEEADDDELDGIIEGYIVEARNFVVGGCDIGLLDKECTTQEVTLDANGVGTINDLLRLVRVTGGTWKRDVVKFLDMGSSDYTMFADPVTAGTEWSPKVAVGLSTRGSSGSATMIAASPAGGSVTVRYVSEQTSLGAGTSAGAKVEGEPLKMAVRNYIAALVCQTWGDEKRSDDFMHLALTYMGVSGASAQAG